MLLLALLLTPALSAPADTTPVAVPGAPRAVAPRPAEITRWFGPGERLGVSLGVGAPLRRRERVDVLGARYQGEQAQNLSLRTGVRYTPTGNWTASVTHFAYARPSQRRPWDPDFVYTVGYEDYRPNTFSLVYANYGGNRLRPDRALGERFTRLAEGAVTGSYRFVLGRRAERLFVPDPAGRLIHTVAYTVVPRYTTARGGEASWKHRLSFATRYAVRGPLFAELTANAYPRRGQQQPWDPDYTYGFGYADYRSGGLVVQYANYSGTRYPWRARPAGTGGFRDGGISVVWSYTLPR